MSVIEYEEKSAEDLIEEVRSYDTPWADELSEESVEEDENFLYIEIEESEDISNEFHNLGAELSAHTAEVNGGESYRMAVKK